MGINFGIPVNTNQTEPPRLWTALRSRQDFVGGLVIIAVAAIGYWLGRGLPGGTDGGIGPGTLPNVPTTKEAGLPDYQVSAWNALFAPKGVPQDIAAKLSETLVQALDDEATRKRLLELGTEICSRHRLISMLELSPP